MNKSLNFKNSDVYNNNNTNNVNNNKKFPHEAVDFENLSFWLLNVYIWQNGHSVKNLFKFLSDCKFSMLCFTEGTGK